MALSAEVLDRPEHGTRWLIEGDGVYAVEEWQPCPCRFCAPDGHWVLIILTEDRAEAAKVAEWRQELKTRPLGTGETLA